MGEAPQEGQGPPGTVEPMMMMNNSKDITGSYSVIGCSVGRAILLKWDKKCLKEKMGICYGIRNK